MRPRITKQSEVIGRRPAFYAPNRITVKQRPKTYDTLSMYKETKHAARVAIERLAANHVRDEQTTT